MAVSNGRDLPPQKTNPNSDIELTVQQHIDDLQKLHVNNMQNVQIENGDQSENDIRPKIWKELIKRWPTISQKLTIFVIFILLYGLGFSLFPNYAKPDTNIMRFIFLLIGAEICGIIVSLFGLPDMLGMLFWGVFYTNIGLSDFKELSYVEAFLREMALVNILLLAGLGLEYDSLKKLFVMVLRLTLIPTCAEVFVITVLSYFLLDMPLIWGALLGLVITAISPNVVITVLLKLKEDGLGLNKGIHTLIIATTSFNDVFAIFVFGVVSSIIFSTSNLTKKLLEGLIGVFVGAVYGTVCGLFLIKMPSNKSKYVSGLRFTVIVIAGALSEIGSKAVGLPSAGALGIISMSFIAGTAWRKSKNLDEIEVESYLDLLWKFLKPVSFVLIGKEVNFSVLEGNIVLYGFVILFTSVIFRLICSYVSTFGGDLNWKEKAYVMLSGFPKATVQAALGPVALDLARNLDDPVIITYASSILIISVLAIIFTAPLGAFLMVKLSTYCLQKSSPTENIRL